MKPDLPPKPEMARPTRVRYGVLGFACVLSMITYLDRVCMGKAAPEIQKEFGLTETQVGGLFTAFALAYALFEVPSGWLGDVFGPRRTLIRIVLWWSAFTALTGTVHPSVTYPALAFAVLLAVRFLFGMGEAGAYPNISRAFHNWFPFQERGSAQGAVWMAGRFAGGITPSVVMALMVYSVSPEGVPVTHWRHTFWIFGLLGVLWCVVFWVWFRDQPEEHPAVNPAELALIRGKARVQNEPERPDLSHRNVPWGRLLGSTNLWSLCLMYSCASYGWYFNITWLPKYLSSRYGMSRSEHGFWTMSLLEGAPLLCGALACLVGGLLTDAFIRRTGDRKWGRRLFGVVGHGLCAVCYFLSLWAGSAYLFVLAIALASFWNDLTMGSAWASCLDIGGRYSGIVSGCMNTVGNLGGAAAGVATGWVLENASRFGPFDGWTVNFLSFGGVYVLATLFWLNFDATQPVIPEEG